MAQFVSDRCKEYSARYQHSTTLLIPPSDSSRTRTTAKTNCIYTVVNDDEVDIEVDILLDIEHLLDLIVHNTRHVTIAAIGVSPIDAMHQRLALCIGFKTEGFVAIAVRLHLLRIEGLNPA